MSDPDFLTLREAYEKFVSKEQFETFKQEFKTFATRMETKMDVLLSDRLPRWAWLVMGLLIAIVGPVIAVVVAYWLAHRPGGL